MTAKSLPLILAEPDIQVIDILDRTSYLCMFRQVKGRHPPGCPRSSFNDVAVRDCQLHRITEPYKDAQNRLLWRDKTCLACT